MRLRRRLAAHRWGRLAPLILAAAVLLAVAVVLLVPETGGAQTVTTYVSNIDQGNDDSTGTSRGVAQRFTTGSQSGGYAVTSVDIGYEDAAGDKFSAAIYTVDSNGYPDSEVFALTAPTGAWAAGTTLSFTAPANSTLAASTTYTVRMMVDSSTVNFDTTRSSDEDSGVSAGWSIQDTFEFLGSSGWGHSTLGEIIRIAIKYTAAAATNNAATGAPTISGTASVGLTLTAATGGIMDSDGLTTPGYTYQWIRVDGSTESDISGATSSTYTLVDADEGKTIKVKVSFTDDNSNAETLTSAATAVTGSVVWEATLTAPAAWGNDGTEYEGYGSSASSVIILNHGTLTPDSFTFESTTHTVELLAYTTSNPLLYFFTDTAAAKADLAGLSLIITVDGAAKTLAVSDATNAVASGATYGIYWTSSDHGYSSGDWAGKTVTVQLWSPNNLATGAPTISGTTTVGQTLTAATSGIADTDGLTSPTYTYQWVRVDGATESDISGATSSTYTLVAADEGKTIKVKVSFTDDASYAETLTSAATVTVTVGDDCAGDTTSTCSVSPGTPVTGDIEIIGDGDRFSLSVTSGVTYRIDAEGSPTSMGTLTDPKLFLLDTSDNLIDSNDDGGTGFNARIVWTADRTGTVYVFVQHTDSTGTGTYTLTVSVTNYPATGAPTITGSAQVGETLTADTSGIMDADGLGTPGYTYQWIRVNGTEADISGATSSTYTLVDADEGKTIKVKVSFSDDNSNAETLTSTATATVAAADDCADDTTTSCSVSPGTPVTGDIESLADRDYFSLSVTSGVAYRIDAEGQVGFKGTLTDPAIELRDSANVQLAANNDGGDGPNARLTWTADTTTTVYVVIVGYNDADTGTYTLTVSVTNYPATGAPTITGSAQVGETLTAATSGIMDADGLGTPGYTYQWIRLDGAAESDISGATSSTYTLVDADEGKTIKVKVSFTDDDSNAETLTSAATVTVTAAANNLATGAPTISGTAQVGQTLTAATSGIMDSDGLTSPTYAYQWVRLDGAAESDISGATSSTYTLVAADAGKTIKVKVSFTDDNSNPETLTSTATATVAAALPGAPLNLSATAGDAAVMFTWGEPLNNGAPITAYRIRYKVSTATAWEDWVTVPTLSATVSGLTNDTSYDFEVQAQNSAGWSASAEVSATPAAVTTTYISNIDQGSDNKDDSSLVRAQSFSTGSQTGGYAVTHVDIGSDDDEGDSFSAAIYTTNASGHPVTEFAALIPPSSFAKGALTFTAPANTTLDAGATYTVRIVKSSGATLKLDTTTSNSEDSGGATGWSIGNTAHHQLSGGSWSDLAGTAAIRIAVKYTPPATNNAATGAPMISGTAQVGETLTAATSGIADSDGLTSPPYVYRWIRVNGTEADISGATSSTYTLVAADLGKTIKVRVSFTDDAGNPETLTSTATSAVAAKPNTPATGAPTISGTAQVGETLTAATSGIADSDGLGTPGYTYQWIRVGSTESDISGATSSTYTLVAADQGKTIKVKVSFSDDASNSETLTSAATSAVTAAAANNPATGAPTISGTAQVGETLTAATSGIMDADGLTSPAYTYQWIRVNGTEADISGATSSTYTLVAADLGKTIKVTVSFTDDGSNPETLTSTATATVTVADTVPGPPPLSASPGHHAAWIGWGQPPDTGDGSSHLLFFQIERTPPGGTPTIGGEEVSGTSRAWQLDDGEWTFRVRFKNSVGWGQWSDPQTVVVGPATVTITGDGAVTEGADAQFTLTTDRPALSFQAPLLVYFDVTETEDVVSADNEGRDSVSFAYGADQFTKTIAVPTDDDSAAEFDSTVTATIMPISDHLTGSPSVASVAVSDNEAATKPAAVADLDAAPADGQAILSWSAVTGQGGSAITRFEYRRKSSGAYGGWMAISGSDPATISHTVTGLTNATAYTFQVRAVNAIGPADPSNEVVVTPSASTLTPAAITDLSAAVGDGQATLSWTVPGDRGSAITKFQYRQKSGGAYGAWMNIAGSGATTASATVPDLRVDMAYTFQVRAVSSVGGAQPSNEARVTILTGVLLTNVEQTGATTSVNINDREAYAQPFRTGSGPTIGGYTLQRIEIHGAAALATLPTLTVTLQADSSDDPSDTPLATFTKPSSWVDGANEFSLATPYELEPATRYHIVVDAGGQLRLKSHDDNTAADVFSAHGWSFARSRSDHTQLGWAGWEDPDAFRMSLFGTITPRIDFGNLASGHTSPVGIWSPDGSTLWVGQWFSTQVYAYNLADETLDSGENWELHNPATAGDRNRKPTGIWSNANRIYVTDPDHGRVFQYQCEAVSWDATMSGVASQTVGSTIFEGYFDSAHGSISTSEGTLDPASFTVDGVEYQVQKLAFATNGNRALNLWTNPAVSKNTPANLRLRITIGGTTKNLGTPTASHGSNGVTWQLSTHGYTSGDWDNTDVKVELFRRVSPDSAACNKKTLTSANYTLHADNGNPQGLWSDGTTAWVSDAADDNLYAYALSDFSRDSGKDIDLASGNTAPRGIWSDGKTIWVLDKDDKKLYAYVLADGSRRAGHDITLDSAGENYNSIWSDGTTMYVIENTGGSATRDPRIHKLPLAGAVLVSNAEQTAGANTGTDTERAQTFRTGDNYQGYTLDSVRLFTGNSVSVELAVWTTDANGYPDAPHATLTPPESFAAGEITFTDPSDSRLERNTTYALRISSPTSARLQLPITASSAEDASSESGWSLGDDFLLLSSTTNAWGPSGIGSAYRVTITGTPNPATVPAAITNLQASAGDTEVALSWGLPDHGGSPLTKFQYRQKEGSGAWESWNDIFSTTSYTVPNLTNDTEYTFQVRAVNAVGDAQLSNEATATPRADECGQSSHDVDATNCVLSLDTPKSGEIQRASDHDWYQLDAEAGKTYQIDLRGAPSNNGTLRDPKITSLYTVALGFGGGPIPGTYNDNIGPNNKDARVIWMAPRAMTVFIGVASSDRFGTGVYGTGTYMVTATETSAPAPPQQAAPDAISDLRASGFDQQVSLLWTVPASNGSAITEFQYRQKEGSGAYGGWLDVPGSGPLTSGYPVPNLTNGTEYTFQVRAVNGVGEGPASIAATATPALSPPDPRPPPPPPDPGGEGSGGGSGGGSGDDSGGVDIQPVKASALFEDVEAGVWYEQAVSWMILQRVTSGCATTLFCPEANLSRRQFVTFLWRAAGRPTPPYLGSEAFGDVTEGGYAEQSIGWAVANGVTAGCTRGEFGDPGWMFCPAQDVTRGQMATLLYRHVESGYQGGAPPYTDVEPDRYYAPGISWLTDFEVARGCGPGLFCPDRAATRAEAAVFINGVAIRPHIWGLGNTSFIPQPQ